VLEPTDLPVQEILNTLGLHLIDCGDYWKFSSPWRTDSDPSCVCYKSTGYVVDFGGSFRGGIKWLVFTLTGHHFDKEFPSLAGPAMAWAAPTKKVTVVPKSELRIPNMDIVGQVLSVYELPDALRYCYSRHMTDQFIKEFELTYLPFGYLNGSKMPWIQRLMIPIKEGGKVLSIEGRDITRKQAKKALYPKTCTTSTLFNIDRLRKDQPLVVVEGIMDLIPVWRVHENVTCTFGIQLSHRQKRLLKEFPNVVLMPDSDEGGERFIDILDSFYEDEFFIAQVPEKDPGDSTEEHIIEALKNRKSVTRYLMEVTGCLEKKEKMVW
jgi:hypothetical protein